MSSRVGLLRAVNLGGHNAVAMADLRGLLSDLGLREPRTLLRSGNVVFEADDTPAALERLLEGEAWARLGLKTEFFVRTAAEWRGLVEANPFRREAESDPARLLAMVAKEAPKPEAVEALRAAIRGRETLAAEGRHAYVVYPDGVGRSKLTSTLIERHLGTRVTGRNWNTVLKLLTLVEGGT